jgi:predicted flap endonuclease-1-like 5' DNA nuclease
MARLVDIEGIGDAFALKLREAGLATTDALLEKGKIPAGREEIAASTGISGKLILEWVNLADLFRIKGVSEEYSDLLEEAGVDTVPELAQRNAANLYQTLKEVNAERRLVRRLPGENQVADWVQQAKELPRIITY